MSRRLLVLAACVCAGVTVLPGNAAASHTFTPGAPGLGDEYFPLDGNGGYDVRHYDLDLAYAPATDRLTGVATIKAKATQNLSRFNLDFDDLTVRAVHVDGRRARWTHADGELDDHARQGPAQAHALHACASRTAASRRRCPTAPGFIHTNDGALAVGQPHGATSWFPANDYVTDKASYTFEITRPAGSRGDLQRLPASGATPGAAGPRGPGSRASRWRPTSPCWRSASSTCGPTASAASPTGTRSTRSCSSRSTRAPASSSPTPSPRDLAYKRLGRTISVPAGGGELSFWVTRDTEPTWDFFFVEAHPVGSDDWTTLPDENGHTSRSTGNVCPFWLELHPFLEHYQTAADEGCDPEGTTGEWHAASGPSGTWEQWTVDLSAYAGPAGRAVADLRQRRRGGLSRRVDRRHRGPGRRRLDVVRGRRERHGRLVGPRAARGQRSPTPTTGSRAPSRSPRRRSARRSTPRSRSSRR